MKKKPRILARGFSQEEASRLSSLLRNLIHKPKARGPNKPIFGTDTREDAVGVRVVAYRMKLSEIERAKAFVAGYLEMVKLVKKAMADEGGYFGKLMAFSN